MLECTSQVPLIEGVPQTVGWDEGRIAPAQGGSVVRAEYLPGIGWVAREPAPQREKRSPR